MAGSQALIDGWFSAPADTKYGSIPLGKAILTSAGRLPFKAIIHVAGINMLWRASEWSIRECVRNAMVLAHEKGFQSIALPLIGAGSGGFNQERAKAIMEGELGKMECLMEVRVVVFGNKRRGKGSGHAITSGREDEGDRGDSGRLHLLWHRNGTQRMF
jgi:O-acetyl-ADP-ribose deacetylase (regulator of RNase III)